MKIPTWWKQGIALVLTLVLIAVVSAYIVHRHKAAHTEEVVMYSTDKPGEELPAPASYPAPATSPDQPNSIELPSLAARGYIQKVGVDQFGAMAVPTNIHLAGWLRNSALLGEKGVSVIDGHVNGPTRSDGIFEDLSKIKTGDPVIITRLDGRQLHYSVLSVRTVATGEAATYLFSQDPSVDSQLNLITCAGTYQKDLGQYDKRVIVGAKLVE